jgi:hypothetical protein
VALLLVVAVVIVVLAPCAAGCSWLSLLPGVVVLALLRMMLLSMPTLLSLPLLLQL